MIEMLILLSIVLVAILMFRFVTKPSEQMTEEFLQRYIKRRDRMVDLHKLDEKTANHIISLAIRRADGYTLPGHILNWVEDSLENGHPVDDIVRQLERGV